MFYSSKVFIEGEDANLIKEGDLVTFINWGNLRITKVNKTGADVASLEADLELDNTDFKKTTKITWLAEHSAASFVPTKCLFFENIISKADLTRDDDYKQYINKNTKVRYLLSYDIRCAELHRLGNVLMCKKFLHLQQRCIANYAFLLFSLYKFTIGGVQYSHKFIKASSVFYVHPRLRNNILYLHIILFIYI